MLLKFKKEGRSRPLLSEEEGKKKWRTSPLLTHAARIAKPTLRVVTRSDLRRRGCNRWRIVGGGFKKGVRWKFRNSIKCDKRAVGSGIGIQCRLNRPQTIFCETKRRWWIAEPESKMLRMTMIRSWQKSVSPSENRMSSIRRQKNNVPWLMLTDRPDWLVRP